MKIYSLVTPGVEDTAKEEIEQLQGNDVILHNSLIEFSCENPLSMARFSQSSRRVVIAIGSYDSIKEIQFDCKSSLWKNISTKSFKVEVENVKGQENRIDISREVIDILLPKMEEAGLEPKIDVKNPEWNIIVFRSDDKYFVGIDLWGELNSREYRVFPHSASFKGDVAYNFVKKTKVSKDSTLLVGFGKDGTIAIEAALFLNNKPVNPGLSSWDLFPEVEVKESEVRKVYGFDEGYRNIVASRKNAKIAGVYDITEFQKYSLVELDVKYSENQFDAVILHITTKDEDKINEIYYQMKYILKSGGYLLLIGRESWTPSVSDKFELVFNENFQKGDSVHKLMLLKKI
jgi:23S rRNA G2445 N2-methylase RlmL